MNDRSATLSKIIMTTALKVIESLPNIPLAIAAGALGALQYAMAASAPIPQYAEGTAFHPGGLAVVGDGGQPEWVTQPGKKGYWSAATDTVVDLARGATVTPLSDIMTTQMGFLSPQLIASLRTQRDNNNSMMVERKLDEVKQAIISKQENTWIYKDGTITRKVKEGNSRTIYLSKRIHH